MCNRNYRVRTAHTCGSAVNESENTDGGASV